MDEASFIPKRRLPQALQDSVADAADIPRPPQQQVRDDESSAQLGQLKKSAKQSLPSNLQEAASLVRQLEREGRRVERNPRALMAYLKQEGSGDTLSADLLAATATLMAAIPEKRKEQKKHLRDLYFRWAREASSVLITKVIDTFRMKK
jgi:hypothetical protein